MRGRLTAALLIAGMVLSLSVVSSSQATGTLLTVPSWTVMVYMANDVSSPLPWEANINSMESALQAVGTNIVVLLDNAVEGDTVLLRIEHDPGGELSSAIVSQEIDDGNSVIPITGEADMASPTTLAAFVKFAASEFVADRLVLVLWGHGSGWRGLCPDKVDLLTIPELGAALEDATAFLGRPLDMVMVDACAQATVEMLAQLGSNVRYFVGAENNVPYQGLPYGDILGSLHEDPGQSVSDFAKIIVSHYIEYAWFVSPYSATMAAFDLAKVEKTLALLDALSLQGLKYDSIFHNVVSNALSQAEYYDTEWYVDLVDYLMTIYASDLPLEMRMIALDTAISFKDALVSFEKFDHPDPYDGVGVEHASGAVIYAPSTSFADSAYYLLALSESTRWDEWGRQARLSAPTEEMMNGPSLSYADSDGDGLQDTAFVEWDESYPLVEAWIYGKRPNGIVLIERASSTDSNISIHGRIGDLVIAASAVASDESAVSYSRIDAVLYGQIRLNVVLEKDGQPVGEDYSIQMLSSNYSGPASLEGDAHVFTLTIPSHASVGEMVVLQVLRGDEKVMTSRVVIGEHDATVKIELYGGNAKGEVDEALLLTFSLLPALLLGIFTAMLYWDHRKSR